VHAFHDDVAKLIVFDSMGDLEANAFDAKLVEFMVA